jgi:pimeloyl-ACP methyl ester carboxylesterase
MKIPVWAPRLRSTFSISLGALLGYLLYQQVWMVRMIRKDMRGSFQPKNRSTPDCRLIDSQEREHYTMEHTVEDGIERVIYRPTQPSRSTPILMQHGMWHGAWCWKPWQEVFAEWGWESHSYSLPGHSGSPTQRAISACTLSYYLGILWEEVNRFEKRPVFFGHSMGVGLGQWWLKKVSDDFPAMVWVAGWDARSLFLNMVFRFIKKDPLLLPLVLLNWDASPLVRSPRHAHEILLSSSATIGQDEFHSNLSAESILPVYQHNPPFWKPPERVHTPILWVAARQDFTISTASARKSAQVFGADYIEVDGGHDLFFEANQRETAEKINNWLDAKVS